MFNLFALFSRKVKVNCPSCNVVISRRESDDHSGVCKLCYLNREIKHFADFAANFKSFTPKVNSRLECLSCDVSISYDQFVKNSGMCVACYGAAAVDKLIADFRTLNP